MQMEGRNSFEIHELDGGRRAENLINPCCGVAKTESGHLLCLFNWIGHSIELQIKFVYRHQEGVQRIFMQRTRRIRFVVILSPLPSS